MAAYCNLVHCNCQSRHMANSVPHLHSSACPILLDLCTALRFSLFNDAISFMQCWCTLCHKSKRITGQLERPVTSNATLQKQLGILLFHHVATSQMIRLIPLGTKTNKHIFQISNNIVSNDKTTQHSHCVILIKVVHYLTGTTKQIQVAGEL